MVINLSWPLHNHKHIPQDRITSFSNDLQQIDTQIPLLFERKSGIYTFQTLTPNKIRDTLW